MAKKLCTACNLRAIGTGGGEDADYARSMGYCNPCCTLFDHENDHMNDHGRTKAECWVCTPALDLSRSTEAPRKGHTNTVAKTRGSHAGCKHERTPAARAACRKGRGVDAAKPLGVAIMVKADAAVEAKATRKVTNAAELPMPKLTPAQLASPTIQSMLKK